mmetsp:Transcript_79796/g.208093  ORF Transcript_79796/g.208093 Transcript_79796/m.208093 type:complete len:275 (-) Transcript_79796:494-1318(-)
MPRQAELLTARHQHGQVRRQLLRVGQLPVESGPQAAGGRGEGQQPQRDSWQQLHGPDPPAREAACGPQARAGRRPAAGRRGWQRRLDRPHDLRVPPRWRQAGALLQFLPAGRGGPDAPALQRQPQQLERAWAQPWVDGGARQPRHHGLRRQRVRAGAWQRDHLHVPGLELRHPGGRHGAQDVLVLRGRAGVQAAGTRAGRGGGAAEAGREGAGRRWRCAAPADQREPLAGAVAARRAAGRVRVLRGRGHIGARGSAAVGRPSGLAPLRPAAREG